MKKISLLLLTIVVIFTTSIFAQKPFSGIITIKTTITGTDDPNITSQKIPDSEIFILGNFTKSVERPQDGVIITSILNGDSAKYDVVFEVPGHSPIIMEIRAEQIKEKMKLYDFKYEYTDEIKVIAGYNCKKVKCTITDLETDEEEIITYYVSNEISNSDRLNFINYPNLIGYPMRIEQEYGEEAPGAILVTEVSSINTVAKIDPIDFLLPSNAEYVKDQKELMQKLGIGTGE
jgi:hypothetical protein